MENPNQGENIFHQLTADELKTMNDIIDKNGQIYKKNVEVNARVANGGEKITTLIRKSDGTNMEETVNTANQGDYIIRNPDGEEYILGKDKFEQRYDKTDIEGRYQSKGYSIVISNPFNKNIEFTASWGEKIRGDMRCYIADVYDPETKSREGKPYIIASDQFNATYIESDFNQPGLDSFNTPEGNPEES